MPPNWSPNHDVRDSQERLVSPRINVSMFPTAVTVGVTVIALPVITRRDRTFILVQNQGNLPVYIGDQSVTATAGGGYCLNPFADITIPCDDTAIVYAVSTDNTIVSVLEGL